MPEPIVALADWQIQLLRFTIFLHSPLDEPAGVWHDATGADPDIDENRSKEGLRRQVGLFGGALIETQVTAARVDILMTPPAPASGVFNALELLPAEMALTTFGEIVHRWLGSRAPPSVRVAFGATFMLAAADREVAYRHLSRLLRAVKVEPEAMLELLYRVNRPIESRVAPSMKLNRLTTWNSMVVRMMAANMFGATGSVPPAVTLVERQFVRLEVDHNTPAERTDPLDSEQLNPIYDELLALAVENAERGECP